MGLTPKQIAIIIEGLNNPNTALRSTDWLQSDYVDKLMEYYIINGLPTKKELFIRWLEESDNEFELVTTTIKKI